MAKISYSMLDFEQSVREIRLKWLVLSFALILSLNLEGKLFLDQGL